jgi:cell division septation protein DedD
MDSPLKQRLIGAAVLVALAVIFLPMLLKGPDVKEPDAAQVPLSMPATPSGEYETRELPLTTPEGTTSPNGVLGLTPAEPEPLPEAASTLAAAPAASGSVVAPAAVAANPPAPTLPAPLPPKPAEATDTPPSAVAAGKYMVNIGSFANLANANALVAKLRAQKLPVVADKVTLGTGSAMRVRVGPYDDRATAEAARLRAEETTGGTGKVVASDAPASALAADAAVKPVAAPAPALAGKAASPPAAAPAVAKPAAPAATNAGSVGFAVQLSAPAKEADAIALRDKARAQGFSAFVQPVETDGGRRYRVRLGPVADRAAALALRDAANGKLGSKGIVVSNP